MKKRLDVLLVEKGLIPTREKARRMIMAGRVTVDGRVMDKPGHQVREDLPVSVSRPDREYVSRGGLKLEGALAGFGVDPSGRTAMDVGASTGGFTDCLLKKGAVRVYAVDVGRGQLDDSLRRDERVEVVDRTNIRYLEGERIGKAVDLAVVDTSFISLELVLPKVVGFVRPGGEILALIKPQFELGPGEVGRGGIVRDPAARERAVEKIALFSGNLGLEVAGTMPSPLTGAKGNVEYFIHLIVPGEDIDE